MRHVIRRTATDGNQPEIVAAMRKVGAVVFIIGQPFDLLVWFRSEWHVLEVKEPKGKLTKGQQESLGQIESAPGYKVAVHVVYSIGDALEAIGIEF